MQGNYIHSSSVQLVINRKMVGSRNDGTRKGSTVGKTKVGRGSDNRSDSRNRNRRSLRNRRIRTAAPPYRPQMSGTPLRAARPVRYKERTPPISAAEKYLESVSLMLNRFSRIADEDALQLTVNFQNIIALFLSDIEGERGEGKGGGNVFYHRDFAAYC